MRSVLIVTLIGLILAGCNCSTTTPAGGGISQDFLFGLREVTPIYSDIDHDGTKEMFLRKVSTKWVAETYPIYLVLKRDGQNWVPMGEVGGAVRILPIGPDGGIRMLTYQSMGSGESIIETLTYRDGTFVCIHSETVHDGDSGTEEGRRRTEELL